VYPNTKRHLADATRWANGQQSLHVPTHGDNDIAKLTHGCKRLVRVSLSAMDVSDMGVKTLCENCPGIEHLDLSRCANLAGVSAHYHQLTNLQSLDLSFTHCSDAVVQSISLCHTLRSLKLGYNVTQSRKCSN
jgi:Leucine-rich repeat (LRR) protein